MSIITAQTIEEQLECLIWDKEVYFKSAYTYFRGFLISRGEGAEKYYLIVSYDDRHEQYPTRFIEFTAANVKKFATGEECEIGTRIDLK